MLLDCCSEFLSVVNVMAPFRFLKIPSFDVVRSDEIDTYESDSEAPRVCEESIRRAASVAQSAQFPSSMMIEVQGVKLLICSYNRTSLDCATPKGYGPCSGPPTLIRNRCFCESY